MESRYFSLFLSQLTTAYDDANYCIRAFAYTGLGKIIQMNLSSSGQYTDDAGCVTGNTNKHNQSPRWGTSSGAGKSMTRFLFYLQINPSTLLSIC